MPIKPVLNHNLISQFFLLLQLKVSFVTKNAGKTLSLLIEKENCDLNETFYQI